jgi:hypothetical protein
MMESGRVEPRYYVVYMQGLLGGNRLAYLFRWSQSKVSKKWCVYMEEKDQTFCIGQMDSKPSNADIESMVYNASAVKSPVTAGVKMLSRLTQGFGKK